MLENARAAMKAAGKDSGKGAYTAGLIMEGKLTHEEIAKKAKTTLAAVYWYRQHLKGLGVKLPETERAAPKAKPAKKPAKKAAKKVAKKAVKKVEAQPAL
jgi:D-serine deaminase-like pyridoxal phosphate-dependent protein